MSKTSRLLRSQFRPLGSVGCIVHFNIESISRAKCEILSQILTQYDVSVVCLQETHTRDETDFIRRGYVPGYVCIGALHHPQYGIATYVRADILNVQLLYQSCDQDVFVLITEINGINIVNVYKPPQVRWPPSVLQCVAHPAVCVGDFNSHNSAWGYGSNDENGNILLDWMTVNNYQLVYNAKDRGTFRSARWQRDYSPDLCFVSTGPTDEESIPVARMVLDDFPHSQHRPVLIEYGSKIPLIDSVPVARWNFRCAKWEAFQTELDTLLNVSQLNPVSEEYDSFVKLVKLAAKRHVPRGYRAEYVPTWNTECTELYDEFRLNHNNDAADLLVKILNEKRRERWHEMTSNLDFTHSSRKAWGLLKKLGNDSIPSNVTPKVSPNEVASRLLSLSKAKMERKRSKLIRNQVRQMRRNLKADPCFSSEFSAEEFDVTVKAMKTGKAAGYDGIYAEFVKHLGPVARAWLRSLFNKILETAKLPRYFRQAKVIAIKKPGKSGDEVTHWRPISLLSTIFKMFERMLLHRIGLTIDDHTPVEQGGFRLSRSCTDQVLTLTTRIESAFQRGRKVGVALVDLTAAYDTVWLPGLLAKIANAIPCLKIFNLLEAMLSNRRFRVHMGEKMSRWKIINDGLPQGSVLAPKLFNLYTADAPATTSKKIKYADDEVLVYEADSFNELENVLTADLEVMSKYYKDWRLTPNLAKSEVSVFHLNNREADRTLNVSFNGVRLWHNPNPVYLGLKLDRTLTYKEHLGALSKKIASRVNIVQKLAGTIWGANAKTLRIASLALVYAPAEYVAPAWKNSVHTYKVDVQLSQAMRIVGGLVKSTNLKWLPVLSNITPPNIRREVATRKVYRKFIVQEESLLHDELVNPPIHRLKSRRPMYQGMIDEDIDGNQLWRDSWNIDPPQNGHLVVDPTTRVPGFELPRRSWTALNRFRTGHGRCNHLMHKWRFKDDPTCSCGHPEQTTNHIVNDCPERSFDGGLERLHDCEDDAIAWLRCLDIDL